MKVGLSVSVGPADMQARVCSRPGGGPIIPGPNMASGVRVPPAGVREAGGSSIRWVECSSETGAV